MFSKIICRVFAFEYCNAAQKLGFGNRLVRAHYLTNYMKVVIHPGIRFQFYAAESRRTLKSVNKRAFYPPLLKKEPFVVSSRHYVIICRTGSILLHT